MTTSVYGSPSALTDTGPTDVIAAQIGKTIHVTAITVTNSHATVGTLVTIASGARTIWQGYAAALGGGFSIAIDPGVPGLNGEAVTAECASSGANVYVSIAGWVE